MPHGNHIYAKASDMANATTCTYPRSEYALPHWKCVLRCCADCTFINIPDQETTKKHDETTPSIRFHIYHITGRCPTHGRISFKDKIICYMCKQEFLPDKSTKIYTRKELVMMDTTISNFHTSFYIPAIQKLAFHLPHVRILGTNHCGELRRTAFKRREFFKMFFVAVIMQRGQQQVLLIKYNLNNAVEIDLCLQKVLHWNISVQHHIQISIHLHFHVHGMQYFTLFNLMTANRMLLLLMHTANV